MFGKTIAALEAALAAATEELEALFVPYDPATGGGGGYWTAQHGHLVEAQAGIQNMLNVLVPKQTAHVVATTAAEEQQKIADATAKAEADETAAEEQVEAPVEAPAEVAEEVTA